jgi:hypothetical protein
MKTVFALLRVYALGVLLQLVVGLGILLNSQAAPFELCPKMQYFERELGKHTIKTCAIWPFFAAKAIQRYYIDELRHAKRW